MSYSSICWHKYGNSQFDSKSRAAHTTVSISASQAAGVIHGALCLLVQERMDPGATREAGSVTANLV